jgi:hypothetical protein
MLSSHNIEVSQKRFFYDNRKCCVTIFIAFAGSDYDLVLGKVDVFDPQPATFHQAQSRSIEEHCH